MVRKEGIERVPSLGEGGGGGGQGGDEGLVGGGGCQRSTIST